MCGGVTATLGQPQRQCWASGAAAQRVAPGGREGALGPHPAPLDTRGHTRDWDSLCTEGMALPASLKMPSAAPGPLSPRVLGTAGP